MSNINSFYNKYFFLSNYYQHDIIYDGILYHSNEAAFQAQKTISIKERLTFSNNDPKAAKSHGRRVKLRDDWEEVKDNIMYEICVEKFKRPILKQKLIDTKDKMLIEGNYWHDNYWGVCTCNQCKAINDGQNVLGEILMRIRRELIYGY